MPRPAVLISMAEKEAQLAVGDPVVNVVRVGFHRVPPAGPYFFGASVPKQSASSPVLRPGVTRVERRGLPIVFAGLVKQALGPKRIAELEIGPGVVGIEGDGFAKVLDR